MQYYLGITSKVPVKFAIFTRLGGGGQSTVRDIYYGYDRPWVKGSLRENYH